MPFEDWNILCWHWMFKIFMPLARWPTKPCTVQCALLGVSSVCWKSWTDAIICRNLATQLSGRLLKITNQITQKPGNKNLVPVKVRANTPNENTAHRRDCSETMGGGNRVGKCLPCTDAELREAWNHMLECFGIYYFKSRMHPIRDNRLI